MTRKVTGVLHTPSPRSGNILLIGHLSTKSSVYSPTSMSRMSQDLVKNHMKSHYQRIASAKACVDTSAPKSMKLTIKERDRKRRDTIQNSVQPASRPSSSHSQTKQEDSRAFTQDEMLNSPRTLMAHTNRQAAAHTENTSMINGVKGDRRRTSRKDELLKEESWYNHRHSRKHVLEEAQTVLNNKEYMTNDLNHFKEDSLSFKQHRITRNDNIVTGYDHRKSLTDGTLQNSTPSIGIPLDRTLYTSTPRHEREDEEHDLEARHRALEISNISFSYKTLASPRRRKKKSSVEIIWTEEQKYLHFISEVTTDVLDRGLFSNRVLNRVFESHIEKRKGDLDEEHMREMIDQLKQDLDITDC